MNKKTFGLEETFDTGPPSNWHRTIRRSLPDQCFKIRNLDTGEEIDVRDCFTKPLESSEIEQFHQKKRIINGSLWGAVERNDIKRCKELLNKEIYGNFAADPDSKGLNDWTALHIASADGFREACEIVASEAKNINCRTSIGRTPLHLACLGGQLQVVEVLLAKGADPNLSDQENYSPLHFACMYGHFSITEKLLEFGADPALVNNLKKTPLDYALNIETYKVFEKYSKQSLRSGYSRVPFFSVMLHKSREDCVSRLIQKMALRPAKKDIQTFKERTKLKTECPKIVIPFCKVGPKDFKGLMHLGKGSFGSVYLVEKLDTGEKFALKLLKKEKFLGSNLVKYAFTERNILKNINHPFIVKLNYSFQTEEDLCLVMDYCPGGNLGNVLIKHRKFSENTARFFAAEVLLALEELHSHGIIFRDLKPENILLGKDGHAKLTDFGLSKEGVSQETLSKSVCGTMAYFAPEMLKKSGHTFSVDWYMLGVVLYEMLEGITPYYSSSKEKLFDNIQRGKLKFPKKFSESARHLISRLLERDQHQRLGALSSEQIKKHSFFSGLNWKDVYEKRLTPPFRVNPKDNFREIPASRIFGELSVECSNKLQDWSFIQAK